MKFYVLSLLAAVGVLPIHAQITNGIEWERTFGGTNADFAHVVKTTSDGGFVLGGYSFSEISGTKSSANFGAGDFWMVKLDANGSKVWDRSFGGSELDRINDLQQTVDGGYIVGGTSFSPVSGNKTSAGLGNSDFWIVKLDASGNKQWEKSYGGTEVEELRVIKQTSDGGYIAGGISFSAVSGNKTSGSFGTNAPDFWIVKLDSSGNKQWDKTFGGADADELHALAQMSDGGFLLGGHSFSGISGNKTAAAFGTNTSDFWIVRIDSAGNKLWDKSYGGSDSEHLYSIQLLTDGGFLLGGSSYSSASGNKTSNNFGSHDFWIVKVSSSGALLWEKSFGGSDADELHSAQQTADGEFIVGGVSFSGANGSKTSKSSGADAGDYWMLKLDAAGNKQWEQSVRGTLSGEILRLQLTASGGYVVAGLSSATTLPAPDFALAKLLAPLRFHAQSFSAAGVFRGELNGVNGTNYVLESSTNLTQWTAVQTNRATNNVVTFLHTNAAGSVRRFYRARM